MLGTSDHMEEWFRPNAKITVKTLWRTPSKQVFTCSKGVIYVANCKVINVIIIIIIIIIIIKTIFIFDKNFNLLLLKTNQEKPMDIK